MMENRRGSHDHCKIDCYFILRLLIDGNSIIVTIITNTLAT